MPTCIILLLISVEREVNRWLVWVRLDGLALDLQMVKWVLEQEHTPSEHCLPGRVGRLVKPEVVVNWIKPLSVFGRLRVTGLNFVIELSALKKRKWPWKK